MRFRTGNQGNCLMKSEAGVLGNSLKISVLARFIPRCIFQGESRAIHNKANYNNQA